jgi:hypothetical protein
LRTDQFNARKTLFLSEQDGPSEQVLKRCLTGYLSCVPAIELAYLVKVSHGESSGQHVALCLVGGKEDAVQIAQSAETVFNELFQSTESLQILFLTDEQRTRVGAIADPFYKADESRRCEPN